MKGLILAAALVLLPSAAFAQATDTIQQNKPFTVAADHDGVDTTTYNLYQNGVKVQIKDVSALVAGTIAFDRYVAGLAKGTYVFYVEAVGPGGVTASDTLTLTVTPGPPKKPVIRIIKG